MAYIFAMSDIHGEDALLRENLKMVDLESDENNKLIFLGDYIDGNKGTNSFMVLSTIYQLQKKYEKQIIVLKGNHEQYFLEWVLQEDPEKIPNDFDVIKTFMSKEQFEAVANLANESMSNAVECWSILNKNCAKVIRDNHYDLIEWMKELPLYYEFETNEGDGIIFVHAGIEEVEGANERWKDWTDSSTFIEKYPPTTGSFYKDIVAGHNATSQLAGNEDFHEVYYDKKNHYFIDGNVEKSGHLLLLKYDTITKKYTSFRKIYDEDSQGYILSEYEVK